MASGPKSRRRGDRLKSPFPIAVCFRTYRFVLYVFGTKKDSLNRGCRLDFGLRVLELVESKLETMCLQINAFLSC